MTIEIQRDSRTYLSALRKTDRSPNAAIFRSLLVIHHSQNTSAQMGDQSLKKTKSSEDVKSRQQNTEWSHGVTEKMTLYNTILMFGVNILKVFL